MRLVTIGGILKMARKERTYVEFESSARHRFLENLTAAYDLFTPHVPRMFGCAREKGSQTTKWLLKNRRAFSSRVFEVS